MTLEAHACGVRSPVRGVDRRGCGSGTDGVDVHGGGDGGEVAGDGGVGAGYGRGRGVVAAVHPERAETVQAELAEGRAEVLAARQVGDEQVEQALVGEWQSRLRRLVTADPQLADELRRVVAELRAALADADTPQGTTITMQATAFGNSRVNQAGRDLRVTTGE